jgi:hypothetical protein
MGVLVFAGSSSILSNNDFDRANRSSPVIQHDLKARDRLEDTGRTAIRLTGRIRALCHLSGEKLSHATNNRKFAISALLERRFSRPVKDGPTLSYTSKQLSGFVAAFLRFWPYVLGFQIWLN